MSMELGKKIKLITFSDGGQMTWVDGEQELSIQDYTPGPSEVLWIIIRRAGMEIGRYNTNLVEGIQWL